MKAKFIIIVIFSVLLNVAYAQKSIMDDVTVKGDIRVGGNYWAFVGVHGTENVSLYTDLIILHKSGLCLRYIAYDDFSKEEKGRVRFFDVAYSYNWKNMSLYGALEYISFDNWHDGERVRPYATFNYSFEPWKLGVGVLYNYCPHLEKKNEVTIYGKVSRAVFRDLELSLTVWYDNIYKDKFYGDICARLQLPKNLYLKSDLLYRDREFIPFIALGWRFTAKNGDCNLKKRGLLFLMESFFYVVNVCFVLS